jgi:hypothetical protein
LGEGSIIVTRYGGQRREINKYPEYLEGLRGSNWGIYYRRPESVEVLEIIGGEWEYILKRHGEVLMNRLRQRNILRKLSVSEKEKREYKREGSWK